MSQQTNERRCAERTAISLPGTLHFDNHDYQIKILDISLCGLSLVTKQAFPQNHSVNVSLFLPSYEQSNLINLKAMVIRCSAIHHDFLHGLAFESLNPHQQLVIQEFTSFHSRLQN